MSTLVKIDGSSTTVHGPCAIAWNRGGCAEFNFQVKPWQAAKPCMLVEVYDGADRVFLGRLQTVENSEIRGMVSCKAVDFKTLLNDLALAANTLDGPSGRHGKVRFTQIHYPTLPEVFKAIVVQAYNTDGTDDHQELLTDVAPAEYVAKWVADASLGSGSEWDALPTTDIAPQTVEFNGDSVGRALSTLLSKYYPGWSWWIDPYDGMLRVVESYSDLASAFDSTDLAAGGHEFVDGIMPSLGGVYSRVIVEGRNCSAVDISGTEALPFVTDDVFVAHESIHELIASGLVTQTTTTFSGIDGDSLVFETQSVVNSYTTWVGDNDNTYVVKQGKYSKDVRIRKYAPAAYGFSGDAFERYGHKRTLRIQDESMGVVLKVATGGAITTEDRTAEMQAFADAIHAVVSKLRWTGSMKMKGGGSFCPLRRVRLRNHSRFGTVDFMPQSVAWDMHSRMRTYTLGDAKYSPVEELKLLQELRWARKQAAGRNAMPSTTPVLIR